MLWVGRYNAHKQIVIRSSRPLLFSSLTQVIRSFTSSTAVNNLVSQQLSIPDPRRVPNPFAKDVAILGAGITGLSTAYHLSQCIPDANITIYEKNNTIGGWMSSEKVAVKDGHVLFEWGPRTLRPDLKGSGRATLGLLAGLNLADQIVPTSKTSPAATNRYIYYPDHLVRMPGPVTGFGSALANFRTVLTEPIFEGAIRALLREPTVETRSKSLQDESVGHFLTRRFGKKISDNIASAFFHGIYAGDLYKLSVRTLLPQAWLLERKDDDDSSGVQLELADMLLKGLRIHPLKNVFFRAFSDKMFLPERVNPQRLSILEMRLKDASVYTFKEGLGALTARLKEVLQQNPKVTIHVDSPVNSVVFDKNSRKSTVNAGTKTSRHDYVVSTLGPASIKTFLESSTSARSSALSPYVATSLKHSNRTVSVMVVNLYYTEPHLIPESYAGFGYLIPRSVPFDQNPERALGVIFGSETSGPRGPDSTVTQPIPRSVIQESLEQLQTERERLVHAYQLATQGEEVDQNAASSPSPLNTKAPKTSTSTTGSNDTLTALHNLRLSNIDLKISEVKETEAQWFKTASPDEIASVDFTLGQDSAPGTKLTVMMGGHWWSDWTESDLPSESEAIEMAKTLLARHLNITATPEIAKARLNRDCIPQYPVGYRRDMASVHEALLSEYDGRFKVAGPWWQGAVGVNDCIRKARETAWAIREQWDDKTGLQEFTKDEAWLITHGQTGEAAVLGDASNMG